MVLLTGANGQLGQDFQKLFTGLGVKFVATDYLELDITSLSAVREFVSKRVISHIINCAAYNDVDKAESEPDKAFLLNRDAPVLLAKVASEIGAIYVNYSTDFVFDGTKGSPYVETDTVSPISVYADSKAQGEKGVLDLYSRSFVIRTSWVFGMGNNNFNKQVINWSKNKDILNIVDDQKSSATYSWDLAEYSWALICTGKYGLYHLSNGDECSKYDQAKYVLDSIGWNGTLGIAKTADFNLPAKRSEYTKLDSSKLEAVISKKIPSWQSGIDRFLKEYL
ncbi:dTDP-4-dehydrorhamnose reductase [Thiospirochaeta perfilievii]|uniref:dTDP-4-dehydrorhamnose reductase n=1 Tax=Thiospirochaeta perfilievii TaxID=252967 RepID=A0A5C1QC06_9SPIO|nr:dTDP-4-dehydrorhamnose reductase [Thiospirochaeta perfilievii]QEN05625.1 dTDP-4-dehydrorhamnose reductase [Thiospirochaeta perfilievii]